MEYPILFFPIAIAISVIPFVITVSTQSSNQGIFIEIQDQGQGMSKEDRKHIFNKFFRVSTGNRHDVKGFGLGLSYVKAIVDMHNGSIDVKSELNKGSAFTVFLPFNPHKKK